MVNGDYSYLCKQKWGDRFALVGDASAFIDPIFSSGVFMAMRSAQILSEVVSKRLNDGVEATEPDFVDAYDRVVSAYDVIDRLIRLFYTPEAINFAQLGSASEAFPDFEHYQNAIAVYHFLIGGDFFEVANKYRDFIETLRDPKMFAGFKNLVIDRPTLSATTCEIDHEVAFHPGSARARAAPRRPAPLDDSSGRRRSEPTPRNFERFTSNTDENCSKFACRRAWPAPVVGVGRRGTFG